LTIIGAFIDEHAGGPLCFSGPYIPFPSSYTDKAQIVEINIAVMTRMDMPKEDRLAEAVVWGLRESAGASDGAAAIVEPVTRDVPVGNLSHEDLQAEESHCVEKVLASFDHLVGFLERSPIRTRIRRTRWSCCARAARGQAIATLARPAIKLRRLMGVALGPSNTLAHREAGSAGYVRFSSQPDISLNSDVRLALKADIAKRQ
jgi:hypothetical protein